MEPSAYRSSTRRLLLLLTVPMLLACVMGAQELVTDTFRELVAISDGWESLAEKEYTLCVQSANDFYRGQSVPSEVIDACAEKSGYVRPEDNSDAQDQSGNQTEGEAICGDGNWSQFEQDTGQCPEDQPTSELGDTGIRIVSVEAKAPPEGACFPPPEGLTDYNCRYEFSWTVEYTVPNPALVSCFIMRNGAREGQFDHFAAETSGTWTADGSTAEFFPSIDNIMEDFVCGIMESSRDGLMIASDKKTITAPLTLRE